MTLHPSAAISNLIRQLVTSMNATEQYHTDAEFHAYVNISAQSLYNAGLEITKRES